MENLPISQLHPQHNPQQIYIGRQPIFNRQLGVTGYELLYRNDLQNQANMDNGDVATAQVIMNSFMEIGLNTIVGSHNAFINMTRSFLVGDLPIPFPTEHVVLEILEDIEVDAELLTGVKMLAAQGFTIALDDFIFAENLRPLVELADIVKIDLLALDENKLEQHVQELRKHKVKLLAEKVETREQFEHCKQLGFDYFQGYFFCKPNIMQSNHIPNNHLATLQLLGKLQNPDTRVEELNDIISRDMSLSYRLLRLINSAYYGLPNTIGSIHQAIVYLGYKSIKRWASLLAIGSNDDKPEALTSLAMIRAKMCELLSCNNKENGKHLFFTVGLFSALDALMDTPMETLVENLPLSNEIVNALLRHEGPAGEALACTLAFERGDWEHINDSYFATDSIQNAYIEAIAWAEQLSSELSAPV